MVAVFVDSRYKKDDQRVVFEDKASGWNIEMYCQLLSQAVLLTQLFCALTLADILYNTSLSEYTPI